MGSNVGGLLIEFNRKENVVLVLAVNRFNTSMVTNEVVLDEVHSIEDATLEYGLQLIGMFVENNK
jgi:hypothetical protein